MATRSDTVLVTGGQGFIGAYVVKLLLEENANGGQAAASSSSDTPVASNKVVIFDVKEDNNILQQVLNHQVLGGLERVYGDISDTEKVIALIESLRPTIIIHLAGLQVPTCRANPVLGCKVNVLGTINIFEGAKLLKEKYVRVSSPKFGAAVTGKPEDYAKGPVEDDTPNKPMTHYGVFKYANEGNARVYWADHQIPSVGLRPFTVEVGMTSQPTKALKALVLGRDSEYTIQFSGDICVSYVEDVASFFIRTARAKLQGAYALNIKGDVLSLDEWIRLTEQVIPEGKGKIKVTGGPLPFPVHFEEKGLEALLGERPVKTTPPLEGIRKTIEQFRKLKEQGLLHDRDL